MSKIIKDDAGGVWVNIYKALKNRDVYWTGSIGYSTKENAMTNLADKLHYIATIDIKQAVEHGAELAKVKQQLAIAVSYLGVISELKGGKCFQCVDFANRAKKKIKELDK